MNERRTIIIFMMTSEEEGAGKDGRDPAPGSNLDVFDEATEHDPAPGSNLDVFDETTRRVFDTEGMITSSEDDAKDT